MCVSHKATLISPRFRIVLRFEWRNSINVGVEGVGVYIRGRGQAQSCKTSNQFIFITFLNVLRRTEIKITNINLSHSK